jgi:hypothetical protein
MVAAMTDRLRVTLRVRCHIAAVQRRGYRGNDLRYAVSFCDRGPSIAAVAGVS